MHLLRIRPCYIRHSAHSQPCAIVPPTSVSPLEHQSSLYRSVECPPKVNRLVSCQVAAIFATAPFHPWSRKAFSGTRIEFKCVLLLIDTLQTKRERATCRGYAFRIILDAVAVEWIDQLPRDKSESRNWGLEWCFRPSDTKSAVSGLEDSQLSCHDRGNDIWHAITVDPRYGGENNRRLIRLLLKGQRESCREP